MAMQQTSDSQGLIPDVLHSEDCDFKLLWMPQIWSFASPNKWAWSSFTGSWG